MITGKTSTGFEFNIPDTVKDDYEVLEAMSALQKGADILQLPILLDRVLGKAQKDEFKEHCRVDGRVSSERMLQEFFEFFSSSDDTKKSPSSQT